MQHTTEQTYRLLSRIAITISCVCRVSPTPPNHLLSASSAARAELAWPAWDTQIKATLSHRWPHHKADADSLQVGWRHVVPPEEGDDNAIVEGHEDDDGDGVKGGQRGGGDAEIGAHAEIHGQALPKHTSICQALSGTEALVRH